MACHDPADPPARPLRTLARQLTIAVVGAAFLAALAAAARLFGPAVPGCHLGPLQW